MKKRKNARKLNNRHLERCIQIVAGGSVERFALAVGIKNYTTLYLWKKDIPARWVKPIVKLMQKHGGEVTATQLNSKFF